MTKQQHARRTKVLLLGQAESGKSTMLKNFQLASCPTCFHGDLPVWKIIIQLNIISSIKKLLGIIEDEPCFDSPSLTPAYSDLRLRLLPLLSAGEYLAPLILPEFGGSPPPLASSSGWTKWAPEGDDHPGNGLHFGHDACVRAGGAWKTILRRIADLPGHSSEDVTPYRQSHLHSLDPTPLLETLASDINALWTDPAVQALLKRKGVNLEHDAGFFLNDVTRIGKPGWQPEIDDILKARLRTFGVEEHRFRDSSKWYIYDVGGSRRSRHKWLPYFDDVQVIVFLAPLVFNQVLDEDRRTNRLDDSINLWKEICSNRLLARVNFILLLNKIDILASTLQSGVQVHKYIPDYGSRPNELEHVVEYFREKFCDYHTRLSHRQRTFFVHQTSAIMHDTRTTQALLSGIREGILRSHLEKITLTCLG